MRFTFKTFACTAQAAAVVALGAAALPAHATNSIDATTRLLSIDAVSMGGARYGQVQAMVNAYVLLGVDGGTPVTDTFDAGTNLLTLGSVSFRGATYSNVRVTVTSYSLLSAEILGGGEPKPGVTGVYANLAAGASLHGAGMYDGAPIGIPYAVVAGSQPKVAITFTDYGDESDPGPYPVPADAPIEGALASGAAFGGDRHVLVIDRDANRLYEMGNAYPQAGGSWRASGGAVFHLDSNTVRPGGRPGWTSADAAGLPIFPGLVRYDEASSGAIRHALRFTVSSTRRAYVPPATHWASSNTSANLPPMGMRVRMDGLVTP